MCWAVKNREKIIFWFFAPRFLAVPALAYMGRVAGRRSAGTVAEEKRQNGETIKKRFVRGLGRVFV